MDGKNTKTFNYNSIPLGFYDEILESKDGMRKFWHWHKFDSVKRLLILNPTSSLMDVGCFAGTFIGRFLQNTFRKKVGVDILENQIEYANAKYSNNNTSFVSISTFDELKDKFSEKFQNITFIEVIEHLDRSQIKNYFDNIDEVTSIGSEMIITTPNYISLWPFLEYLVNKISKVKYEEQHITKFNYFNFEKKLAEIVPDFNEKYKIKVKTTSHFLSPFISILSYGLAVKISQIKSAQRWKNPFGAMILLKIEKIH